MDIHEVRLKGEENKLVSLKEIQITKKVVKNFEKILF